MSVNYVVWVIAGQYLLAFKLGWFPVWGFESWSYLLLPVLIGVATGMGRDLRLYRAVTLEEMNREYVRTARAKGAGPARILFGHVVPNVLIPVITNVSLSLPFLFTGSLLLESYFGIPGLGNLGLNAIHAADVNVVRAIVVIGAVLYMLANLAADIAYGLVDPRARAE
jgi:peptide/nickel transport system permease protein